MIQTGFASRVLICLCQPNKISEKFPCPTLTWYIYAKKGSVFHHVSAICTAIDVLASTIIFDYLRDVESTTPLFPIINRLENVAKAIQMPTSWPLLTGGHNPHPIYHGRSTVVVYNPSNPTINDPRPPTRTYSQILRDFFKLIVVALTQLPHFLAMFREWRDKLKARQFVQKNYPWPKKK